MLLLLPFGAYSEIEDNLHIEQLSFRTQVDLYSLTAHEPLLSGLKSATAVSVLSDRAAATSH